MASVKPSRATVWLVSSAMVLLVSCCSLIGVSIMPLISGPMYKSSITCFTGLAVGSLLGSAIFSLIPQAFNLTTQSDKAYLWKSLVVFGGIYLFYCSERFLRMYFDRKAKKDSQHEQQMHLKDDKMNPSTSDAKLTRGGDVVEATGSVAANNDTVTEICLAKGGHDEQQNKPDTQQNHHHHHHHHHHHDALRPHEVITKALKSNSNFRSANNRNTIAPLAWMIIIGDGLHNFIDGLSIGAAFSESIYQGMIICTAVIFEELPHELGDFAVLIASGMTVKQALGYNFLSACTCFLGMAFGIVAGESAQSASFIFALAAGMFLYISLVDMMGELSAALEESKDSPQEFKHLLLMQNIGILTGITIIFSLSMFGPSV